jgi:hypothetical protein
MDFAKKVVNLMKQVRVKDVVVKDSRHQLTLEGGEELEIEGYVRVRGGRITFKLVVDVKNDA